MKHRAVEDFWELYDRMHKKVRQLADKNYELLKSNPSHLSLDLKAIKPDLWSIRVGLHYRALAYPDKATLFGFGSVRTPNMIG